MRKATDHDIREAMRRIEAGEATQKQIAGELGVTPSALNQRIQRIRAQAPPESMARLTGRQRRFVIGKAQGQTNLEAVKSAGYDITSDQSGKSIATVLMKDPDIGTAISDLMAQEGITRRRRVQRLRDMIESPDLNIVGKGLDQSWKLTGDYQPEQIQVITDAEIRALVACFPASSRTTASVES